MNTMLIVSESDRNMKYNINIWLTVQPKDDRIINCTRIAENGIFDGFYLFPLTKKEVEKFDEILS